MATYALVDENDTILKFVVGDRKQPDPIGKGWRWLVVEDEIVPFDSATEILEFSDYQVTNDKVVRKFEKQPKPEPVETAMDLIAKLEARIAALEAK